MVVMIGLSWIMRRKWWVIKESMKLKINFIQIK